MPLFIYATLIKNTFVSSLYEISPNLYKNGEVPGTKLQYFTVKVANAASDFEV
jgi:hypothetical protein